MYITAVPIYCRPSKPEQQSEYK